MSEQKLPEPTQPDLKSVTEAAPDTIAAPDKSAFIDPDVSVPVDVLEATTFFQSVTNAVILP